LGFWQVLEEIPVPSKEELKKEAMLSFAADRAAFLGVFKSVL
jgi:hypothetical protein